MAAGLLTTGLLVPLLATGAAAAGGSVTGAVFTTNEAGSLVNGNIYAAKTDVYLNGGPNAPKAHRLAEGDYFFAVLVPGGQHDPNDGTPKNLSDDVDTVVHRTFHANADGTVSPITGLSSHYFTPDGGVQLFDFANTTNPGGEYIAAVCQYESDGSGGASTVEPNNCKYDAFKVKASVTPCTTDCVTVDEPTGSKTATPQHDRTLKWTIGKSANRTSINQLTPVTVTYTITVTKTLVSESWGVSGTITVNNPNTAGLPVTVADTGLAGATALCTVTAPSGGTAFADGTADATVAAESSAAFPYSCTVEDPGTGTYENTATIGWTDGNNSPQSKTVSSTSFDFNAVTDLGDPASVTLTDTYVGTGSPGTGVTLSDGTTVTYFRTLFNANCQMYPNTARLSTGASDTASVTFCGPNNGGLTMGWWQNNNGQALLTKNATQACTTLNGYVGTYTADGDLINISSKATGKYVPASCPVTKPTYLATFTYNAVKAANASGTGQPMLLGQWLTTALDTAAYPVSTTAGKPTLQSTQTVANPANLLGVGTCAKVGDLLSQAVSQFGSYKADKAKVTALATLFDNINNNRAQTCQL